MLTGLQAGTERTVEEWLMKRFEGILVRAEREKKWDLNLVSSRRHCAGRDCELRFSQITCCQRPQYFSSSTSGTPPTCTMSVASCCHLPRPTRPNSQPWMLMPTSSAPRSKAEVAIWAARTERWRKLGVRRMSAGKIESQPTASWTCANTISTTTFV